MMCKSNPCLLSVRRLGFAFRLWPFVLVLGAVAPWLLTGCDRKSDVKSSISQLEKALATKAASGPAEPPTPGGAPRAEAIGYVQTAILAVRSNDYATAVALLNAAVRAPGLTPDQFLAVQQAKNALLTDLLNRAQKGDASAQATVKALEQTHSR